jgi:hypothetical protein
MNNTILRPGRRNRYAAPIGGVFIILCLVGFFTVASVCLNATKSLLDNSKAKQEYEKMLLPVVIFDPVPFENPVNIDNASLLQYSIWATAMGDKRDQYEYDDNNMMVIPASDVDVAALELFGPDVKLEHQSFGDLENSYLYDEDIKSYHVPIITVTGFATPKVEEINKVGDTIELKMGYVPPSTILDIDTNGKVGTPEPQKYMIYELHRAKSGWYLYAIKDLPGTTLITGSDAVLPTELPVSSLPQSDVVPEAAGNAQEAASGSSSDGGSSSEEEASSSGGEDDTGEEGDGEEDEEGEGEQSTSSSEESAPELQG